MGERYHLLLKQLGTYFKSPTLPLIAAEFNGKENKQIEV
jgi:hypothetical protein